MTTETCAPTPALLALLRACDGSIEPRSQGAEARVYDVQLSGVECVAKQRFAKTYRLRELDERLTRSRLSAEARTMVRARKLGVLAPHVVHVDVKESCVYMERIRGCALKEALRSGETTREDLRRFGEEIGVAVAKLHDGGIIHGDLTTSNLMVRDEDGRVVVIDFGLSYPSKLPEDKGVDLYVLERAITAAHPSQTVLFDDILAAYKKTSQMWCSTLNRFAEVRARGRKRSMVG
ncbi:Serine/threonine protein kinase [Ostreococcus tauri]|uniref:non-specific serine/threonine protein kinase n=1 Tax=Ostreococcus tauri TaxID=70448 RepID=A0A1Y5ILE3_OSTTA|nr:Serine/threonine protein kinase [Ostreococcus tauri]